MHLLFCLILLVLFSLCFTSFYEDVCNDGVCAGQNGFQNTRTFNTANSVLKLAGTGVRRKNLLVVDVDVYAIGFYLSEKKIKAIQKSIISSSGINKAVGGYSDDIQAGIVLRFLRNVETKKIVDAIGDSLKMKVPDKEYASELESFKTHLTNLVGKSGAKLNDEIEFMFKSKNNDEFGLSVNKSQIQWFTNKQLRLNIIEIYSDKEKSVSLDLVNSLVSNIKLL